MTLSAVITEAEDGVFMAYNPETGTSTEGATFDEAVANLREATAMYLELFPIGSKSPAVVTSFELSQV
jgi:predicted RNase H-like HicB family nuclease